jgi:hypothetical protein
MQKIKELLNDILQTLEKNNHRNNKKHYDNYKIINLQQIIQNKTVALVGPSNFLHNKKLGKLIDSYDVVIKVNNFHILPSIDYGKKTDILFHNFFGTIPDKSVMDNNTKLLVGSHPFPKCPNNPNKQSFQISKKKYNNILHQVFPEELLSVNIKKLINNDIWKTSGFRVICLLLDKIDIMKQLNIFGIDFCFNNYNLIYNKNNTTPSHNIKKELYLFKELFKNYKNNKNVVIHDKYFLKYLNETNN